MTLSETAQCPSCKAEIKYTTDIVSEGPQVRCLKCQAVFDWPTDNLSKTASAIKRIAVCEHVQSLDSVIKSLGLKLHPDEPYVDIRVYCYICERYNTISGSLGIQNNVEWLLRLQAER